MGDIHFIVDRLNEPPFSMPLSLVAFDEKWALPHTPFARDSALRAGGAPFDPLPNPPSELHVHSTAERWLSPTVSLPPQVAL